jgi:hypothetical protein
VGSTAHDSTSLTDPRAPTPPSLTKVAPKWEPGDTIPLGRRTLQVIGVRYDDDQPAVLIVEDMSV